MEDGSKHINIHNCPTVYPSGASQVSGDSIRRTVISLSRLPGPRSSSPTALMLGLLYLDCGDQLST